MGYSVGEAAHLGVAALAGVASEGIGEGDYLLERSQDTATRRVATHLAADPVLVVVGCQPARFTEGADQGLRSGSLSR